MKSNNFTWLTTIPPFNAILPVCMSIYLIDYTLYVHIYLDI